MPSSSSLNDGVSLALKRERIPVAYFFAVSVILSPISANFSPAASLALLILLSKSGNMASSTTVGDLSGPNLGLSASNKFKKLAGLNPNSLSIKY